jgi:hypothetical protein
LTSSHTSTAPSVKLRNVRVHVQSRACFVHDVVSGVIDQLRSYSCDSIRPERLCKFDRDDRVCRLAADLRFDIKNRVFVFGGYFPGIF